MVALSLSGFLSVWKSCQINSCSFVIYPLYKAPEAIKIHYKSKVHVKSFKSCCQTWKSKRQFLSYRFSKVCLSTVVEYCNKATKFTIQLFLLRSIKFHAPQLTTIILNVPRPLQQDFDIQIWISSCQDINFWSCIVPLSLHFYIKNFIWNNKEYLLF